MNDDIVTRLRNRRGTIVSLCDDAADEIERLHRWASYEHAGYCACAGGDKDCLERAYNGWKKMFDE